MGETPTPGLDDATVEAIAAEAFGRLTMQQVDWRDRKAIVKRIAARLPDPRPTEAEVQKVLMDYWDWNNVTRVLRHLGCFRPEAGDPDA